MYNRPGPYLASFKNKVGDRSLFKQVSLTKRAADDKLFQQSKEAITEDKKQFLVTRSKEFQRPLLRSCCVPTNHKSWPRNRNDLGLYGEELENVAQHYQVIFERNDFDLCWLRISGCHLRYIPTIILGFPLLFSLSFGKKFLNRCIQMSSISSICSWRERFAW